MKKINKSTSNFNKSENKEYEMITRNKFRRSRNFGNNSSFRIKVPEYYKMNLDRVGKYQFSGMDKIDGFTLKTIKSNKSTIEFLTDYEKKIFCQKLGE